MFENRGNIERKIDMAIGQRDRGDIAVHLDQLRLDPFVAAEALLERNFHREPKHAHSGIENVTLRASAPCPQSACLKTRTITATVRSRLLMWCAAFEKNFLPRRREAHEGLERF